jgi:hypothetical protein
MKKDTLDQLLIAVIFLALAITIWKAHGPTRPVSAPVSSEVFFYDSTSVKINSTITGMDIWVDGEKVK